MPSAPPARSPAARQGPLRAAVAIFVVGFLVVWLIKPIGNPCPDLGALPAGSAASSSPSFSPPGARTCTYTAAAGVQATAKYMPWLDWIVLLMVAALAAGVVRMLSPAGREGRPKAARPKRAPRAARAPRAERAPRGRRAEPPRPPRAERAARPPRAEPAPRAPSGAPPERPPRAEPAARAPSGAPPERDAAERERARRERAARDRARRGR